MSYYAFFQGVLASLNANHWGTKIFDTQKNQPIDTGVEPFVEQLLANLSDQTPIPLSQPITFNAPAKGPSIVINTGGNTSSPIEIRQPPTEPPITSPISIVGGSPGEKPLNPGGGLYPGVGAQSPGTGATGIPTGPRGGDPGTNQSGNNGSGGGQPQQTKQELTELTIQSVSDDTLSCIGSQGQELIVKRPFRLRMSTMSGPEGVTYSAIDEQTRMASIGDNYSETQRITPAYNNGDTIYAMPIVGSTEYVDMNVDARCWGAY